MNMKTEVLCPQCGNHFFAYGNTNTLTRCPRCSSMGSSFISTKDANGLKITGNGGESIRATCVPFKYTCHNCEHTFDYDASSGKPPYCSKCRAVGLKPKSPSVTVYTGSVTSKTGVHRYAENVQKSLEAFDNSTQVIQQQLLILGASEKVPSFQSYMMELRNTILDQVRRVKQEIGNG